MTTQSDIEEHSFWVARTKYIHVAEAVTQTAAEAVCQKTYSGHLARILDDLMLRNISKGMKSVEKTRGTNLEEVWVAGHTDQKLHDVTDITQVSLSSNSEY